MDIIPPRFSDEQVGLEAPPAAVTTPDQGLEQVSAVVITCPSCGCSCGQDVIQMVDDASVAECPQCQCQFDHQAGQECSGSEDQAPDGPPPSYLAVQPVPAPLAYESGVQRTLGRIFERHVRRHQHALKRSVSQYQPKLP